MTQSMFYQNYYLNKLISKQIFFKMFIITFYPIQKLSNGILNTKPDFAIFYVHHT